MRTLKFLSVFLLIAVLLAACGPAATEAPAATEVPATEAPTVAPTEAPTLPPPTAIPTSAAALPEGVSNVLTVKLKPGLKWSDGSAMTAKDIVGSYDIMWAQGYSVWSYINDVKAVDDVTIDFYITTASPRALRLILRSNQPVAYSEYGKWMDQFAQFRKDGKATDSDEVKKAVDDLLAYKPTTAPVVYGPYNIDPASVTEAQMTLVKNPTGYNADKIDFSSVLIYFGETAASLPLVLSNEVDYSTHGYTASDVEQISAMPDMKVLSGPTGTGPGLWFNEAVAPLDKKEVRQAFAYIIDREENAKVAMGPAGKAIEYEAGFTDLGVKGWLTADTIAKLNPYKKDWAKAEELLTSVGFKKGSDGKWLDDQGKPVAFELSVPADFADWLGAAENASQQLNAFGFDTKVRGYPSADRATTQKEGKYQILVDLAIYYNPPHPQTSFNYYLNTPRNNPEATDGLYGFKFPWKQTLADGTEVNIPDLLKAAADGFDFEAQKPAIQTLSLLVNDQLPVLALFERYATDPINFGTRVDGWLPFDNPMYQNGQGSDNYIAIQFLEGDLKKSATGDGSFHTVYPYIQPPTYDLNYFTDNSLQNSLGTPSYSLMYPPLFWYMWATGEYVPVIAESYSLR